MNLNARPLAALMLAGLLGGLAFAAVRPAGASTAAGDESVAYQVDAAHDGSVAGATEAPPLARRWSRDLGAPVSYPVITQGRVFVTVGSSSAGIPATLYALDATNGQNVWGPVILGGAYGWSAAAAGGGQVFALNHDGVLRAFDLATGTLNWTATLAGQTSFSSPPTYASGMVYTGGAGSGGTVYAVRATDGTVAWTAPVMNGDSSSPAVSSAGVFTSYACQQAYDFDPATGAAIWHHATGCEGGGGATPMLAGARLWIRDGVLGNAVLDAATGQAIGTTFTTSVPPAFDGTLAYVLSGNTGNVLEAINPSTQAVVWSFSGPSPLVSAPIVVNGYVYEASSTGAVWALSAATGAVAWTSTAGGAVTSPAVNSVGQPTPGLAAGQGLVVVPASTTLVAFGHLDADLGLSLPSGIAVNATGHAGAAVSFSAMGTDPGGSPAVACSQASGTVFPIGTTTVTCSATDPDDTPGSVTGSFTVTVRDTDLVISVPAGVSVATHGSRAVSVAYTASASDEGGESPSVACDHASGSLFPVGTTKVTCSATDSDDTPSSVSASFTVTVSR